MKTAVLLCALLWSLVDSQPTAPYISFRGVNLLNHGYVNLSLVGDPETSTSSGDAVQCHTDIQACCSSDQPGMNSGNWFFPDRMDVPFASNAAADIHMQRTAQRVELRRRMNAVSPSGIYRCEIMAEGDDNIQARERVYVGIYGSGGEITIPGDSLAFALMPDNTFTLTCISTGGPATTVTWTRDTVTVTEGNVTVFNTATAATTAEYTHTLTGSTAGVYMCTVANTISSASASYTVEGTDPPTNVMAVQEGPTGIRVSWSQSSGATGYIISYTGGNSDSVTVDGTTNEELLTGLLNGETYTISIVATSDQLPSGSVAAMDVSLGPGQLDVSVTTIITTSITLSWSIPIGSVVTSYEVMWQRDTTVQCPDVNQGSATISGSSTRYTITGLEEDSSYDITVTANNNVGSSEDTVTAMTEEAAPSAPPDSVSISAVTSSSITVQWEMVPCIEQNGDITGYSVEYTGGGTGTIPVMGGDTMMVIIQNLMPSTTYSIQVAAVNNFGAGPFSAFKEQQTADVLSVMSVNPSSPTSLTISWTVDDGVVVDSYTISYTTTECVTDSGTSPDITGSARSHELTGLEEGTEYSITVTATLTGSGGTVEDDGTGTTMEAVPSAPPGSVSATSTSSGITVQWEMVPCIHRNGVITSYSVQYEVVGSGSPQTVPVSGGDTVMTVIHDIESSTTYSIQVAAVNGELIGPYSNVPVIVETPQNVYLSLNGDIIPNHGYVLIDDIGSTNTDALLCLTNGVAITDDINTEGNWFSPNGVRVTNEFHQDVPGFRRTRSMAVVRLLHQDTGTAATEGIYHCNVQDAIPVLRTVYVGLYNSGGGVVDVQSVVFSQEVITSPQFTLTCISTGGPATTVTWTRGSQTAVGERRSEVVNGVTAQYTHTLTVTGRQIGLYTCTVTNTVSPEDSESFTVSVTSAPTNVMAEQEGPTDIRVMWTPSTGADGYIISYSNGSSSDRVTVSGGSAREQLLTGLLNGATYTISIIATSQQQLPSEAVNIEDDIMLVPPPNMPTVDTETAELGSTSISLSWTVPDDSVVTGSLVMWELASSGGSSARAVRDDGSGSSPLLTDTRYTITGLRSSTSYNITVILINPAGNSSLQITLSTTEEPTSDEPSGDEQSSSNVGAAVGGALAAIIIVAAIAVVVILVLWRRRRDSSTKYSPTDKSGIHYSVPGDTVSSEDAPCVVMFPEDTHVQEGEGVVFQVEVTGVPRPKLRWYHDGEEVVADYSKELSEDGSLTMPSAETKHSGVYQLVAVNSAGRVEREVKLTVEPEGEEPVTEEPSYDNVTLSGAVSVSIFGNHVEQRHSKNNKPFKDEYEGLPTHGDKSIAIATSPNNKLKNRFANICVYDDNRVVLKPVNQYDSDYVNASYVDGHSMSRKFIATQGPLPKTVVDFWRLVWQERAPTVVMITNLVEGTKIKCQQYWPESGAQTFGPFQVTISDQQILADYTIRSLQVQLKGSSERGLKVTQFHFTAWPDHGVPDYATPILAFHRRVTREHKTGPIVVHCSAGVGRTGTFITIDRMLDQAAKEGVVDIPDTIASIRKQRTKMVQTVDQYVFIHDAILEAVTCGDTQIVSGDLRSVLNRLQRKDQSGKTEMETQFAVLDQVSPNPRDAKVNVAKKNPKKNRSKDFLPLDKWRVVLKGETPDYVNASVAHGYKQQRAFIIAQSPMQSTVRDFWKMVSDRKCGVMVMLNNLVENGKEVCYQYWPSSGTQTYGEFTVELLGEEELSGFTLRTFGAFNSKSGKSHQVNQFHITNWAPDGSCGNLKTVTDVIEEVGKVQRRTGNHPILAHCSDTVSRSGMFCAITTTIERCKTEGVVDVFQVVKALRVQKPGAVRTVLQYRVIFEAVLEYLDSFALYSNF